MPTFLVYILKFACSLSIVWLFYRVFLHNLTFYNANRWYLVGYALMSFVVPLINIGPIDREDPAIQPLIVQYIPVIGEGQVVGALSAPRPAAWATWTWPGFVLVLVGVGTALLLLRFFVRCLSLRRMRQRAELLVDGEIKIYRVRDRISPFSFGNAIYINTSQHSEKEKEEIILHEYVHIRQRHTVDILFAEFITIFNWYNPFAWLIRYSIRQNLEFIADRQVVENGFDKKDYQYHLLKVIGQAQYRLANNFNFSSLKKRIAMMNKIRSARLHLLKFLFILPLLAALLVAFRDRYSGLWEHTGGKPVVNVAGIVFDLESRAPLAGVVVRERTTGLQTTSDGRGFYKLPIPVVNDSLHIKLDFTKPGYDSSFSGFFSPSVKASLGKAIVVAMWTRAHKLVAPYMEAPYVGKLPDDPGYEDVVKAWKDQLHWNDDYAHFVEFKKAHPEVSLFYTAEDGQQHLVLHKDGRVEKYGYPGGPTVADMEKKYGSLPDLMKPSPSDGHPTAGTGYLARWTAISAQAEKEFRPANSGALAIVFPGDSRVIVVDAMGMARIYDMDNDDPKERPEFERLYGKLPDCVPAGFHYNYRLPARRVAGDSTSPAGLDTSAPKHDTPGSITIVGRRDTARPMVLTAVRPIRNIELDSGKVLCIVDGVIKGHGWINVPRQEDIASMEVLKDEPAVRLFGAEGAYGVIAILTKGHVEGNNLDSMLGDIYHIRKGEPLIVIDGVPVPGNGLHGLNPDEIESIQVLREASSKALYGDKAQYGALLITTKKKVHAQVMFEGTFKGEIVTGQADTIVTPQGSFHAVEPPAGP
jgi:TonB-dependent SusC/RagA subfamily outer membrane receptor